MAGEEGQAMLILVLLFAGLIYFGIKFNHYDLTKRRNDLLDNLSKECSYLDSREFIGELRSIDFKLFGGCKSNNEYARCYLCDIKRCPRHRSNDVYYKMLNPRGIEIEPPNPWKTEVRKGDNPPLKKRRPEVSLDLPDD